MTMSTILFPKPCFSIRQAPKKLSNNDLVEISLSANPGNLPVMIRPTAIGVDPFAWVRENAAPLNLLLLEHGAILLRGFGLGSVQDFHSLLDASGIKLMNYIEKATPREKVSGQVYTSTIFPPEHRIALHNELSYVRQWPGRIAFFCEVAPGVDGETPIADVRRVLARIAPEVREKFDRLGWLLVRNFGSGIGPSWQDSLSVQSGDAAEAYFRKSETEWQWLDGNSDKSRLRTFQRRLAVQRHPMTGEDLWFNHIAFWHSSTLAREVRDSLLADFGRDNLPYETFYGDGSEISKDVIEHLSKAYDAETLKFPWVQGDLLLLDNMLVAHGRSTYSGQRRILTAMGDEVCPDRVLPNAHSTEQK
jgi:alpha-ketoglutarate-dependent taurine dioxygenase